MAKLTDAELTDKALKLRQIADNISNICEATLRDVLDTLSLEWKSDASNLFVSRMEGVREEIIKDAKNLTRQSNDIIL